MWPPEFSNRPTTEWDRAADKYVRPASFRGTDAGNVARVPPANGREYFGREYVGRDAPSSSGGQSYTAARQTPLGPYGWEAFGPGNAYQETSHTYDSRGRIPTTEIVSRANFAGGLDGLEGYETMLLIGGAILLVIIVGLIIANVAMLVTVSGALSAMQAIVLASVKVSAPG